MGNHLILNKYSAIKSTVLSNPIEYLKGVGPLRADLLKKELQIFTFGDLLHHYPYRHLDRTKVQVIAQINPAMEYVQVRGILLSMEIVGEKRARRLVAQLRDATGTIELTWFQGINWVEKALMIGQEYLAFGKPGFFLGKPQITHPELETLREANAAGKRFFGTDLSGYRKAESKGLECQSHWQTDAATFFGAGTKRHW